MPVSKSPSTHEESGGYTPAPQHPGQSGESRLVTELIGALRGLGPGPGEVTSFQQAIIEEHAELKRALRGPQLLSAGPVIAGFSPASGKAGTTALEISGERLADATLVRIGAARITSFTVTPTTLALTVPPEATSSEITVFTPLGVAASASRFEVTT